MINNSNNNLRKLKVYYNLINNYKINNSSRIQNNKKNRNKNNNKTLN